MPDFEYGVEYFYGKGSIQARRTAGPLDEALARAHVTRQTVAGALLMRRPVGSNEAWEMADSDA